MPRWRIVLSICSRALHAERCKHALQRALGPWAVHQGRLHDALDDGVEHLEQRVARCALHIRRVAADRHVEHRAHRLPPFELGFNYDLIPYPSIIRVSMCNCHLTHTTLPAQHSLCANVQGSTTTSFMPDLHHILQ